MTTPLSSRLLTQAASDLAADGRSLDALKRDAQRDPQGAVKKAAQQFEALFMQMVLKSMRDAVPKSGMFDSAAQDMATSMLDQQLAVKVAGSGTGLADVIARQLTRHLAPAGDGAATLPARSAPSAAVDGRAAPPDHRAAAGPSGTTAAAADRYAELARPAARAASRYDEIARGARSDARPDYLARRSMPPLEPPAAPAAAAAPAVAAGSFASNPQRAFITRHWDSALAAERATGIPARFVLSQAALESGWGKAEIKGGDGLPSHNLFGIKAGSGWRGRTVDVVTTEYENGVAKKVVERFRAYISYSEAFRDWAQLLATSPRYAGVLAQGRDAAGFAHGLQRAGYATDPDYGAKLARVIASLDQLQPQGPARS